MDRVYQSTTTLSRQNPCYGSICSLKISSTYKTGGDKIGKEQAVHWIGKTFQTNL
jgi:hypothetical protein